MSLLLKPFPKRYKLYLLGVFLAASLISIPLGIAAKVFDAKVLVLMTEDYIVGFLVIGSLYAYDVITNKFSKPWENHIWKKLPLLIVSAFLAGILANEMELAAGFEDDDYINLGFIKFNPYWTNVVVYCALWTTIGTIFLVSENMIDKQQDDINKFEKEVQILQTELYSANIKPHFIFNTLNGVLTLIHEAPDKAESLLIKLSDFLRNSLYSPNKERHSLQQEMKVLEDYLNIEKIRFGKRFNYAINLDADSGDTLVPRFFLLPLVENCIKHNSTIANLTINIGTEKTANGLYVYVEDNGSPFPAEIQENSGLQSVRALLHSCFGKDFDLRFTDGGNTKRVVIKLKNEF
ncbi:MAG: histidine kinase [Bacteroidia bacterium]|nr:histidine kinase [Bacteroidia bacterium]